MISIVAGVRVPSPNWNAINDLLSDLRMSVLANPVSLKNVSDRKYEALLLPSLFQTYDAIKLIYAEAD